MDIFKKVGASDRIIVLLGSIFLIIIIVYIIYILVPQNQYKKFRKELLIFKKKLNRLKDKNVSLSSLILNLRFRVLSLSTCFYKIYDKELENYNVCDLYINNLIICLNNLIKVDCSIISNSRNNIYNYYIKNIDNLLKETQNNKIITKKGFFKNKMNISCDLEQMDCVEYLKSIGII